MVARVSRQGNHCQLMNTWIEPCHVENRNKEHAYIVQHLVTAELRNVHAAAMRFYADDQPEITGDLLRVFK